MKIGVKFLTTESLTLKPIIEKLLGEFSDEIKKKHITVTVPENDDAWPLVKVDAERIKDALAILLDNAIQYNHEVGSITIETKRGRDKFILRISNTGLGINREDTARLFTQSFFRTKEARRVNPTGMGVGLLVAKTIIEAHKGSIALESSTEKGAAFRIALPLSG
jgi:two-component system sensor histidine kinase ResE